MVWRTVLLWHLVGVAALTVLFSAVLVWSGEGVDPLALPPYLGLTILGLPWSVGVVVANAVDADFGPGRLAAGVLVVAPAVVNLVLHGLFYRWHSSTTGG